jgi:hypothetical protein
LSFSRVRRYRSTAASVSRLLLDVAACRHDEQGRLRCLTRRRRLGRGGFRDALVIASGGGAGRREQKIQQSFVHALVGQVLDLALALLADHLDRAVDEIADHPLDIASDVADLGELRRLDLDERRAGQLGQAACDLGLPHPGRTDENDVVRRDLVADAIGRLLASPPIPEGNGDRLLGVRLSHDVAVQLGDDLARCQVRQAGERLLRAR